MNQKKNNIMETVKKQEESCHRPQKLCRAIGTPVYSKTSDLAILTVYQCKSKKRVCILSYMYSNVSIDSTEKSKPEIIEFYNKTKCGVDVTDQMARQYSVKAGTRRWPVAVFYNMLDMACNNPFTIYKMNSEDKLSRRHFIFKLTEELREDYLEKRKARKCENELTKSSAADFTRATKRKQCQIIANFAQNKTKKYCYKCNNVECGKYTARELSECITCADVQ